jgi:hypothetical protein
MGGPYVKDDASDGIVEQLVRCCEAQLALFCACFSQQFSRPDLGLLFAQPLDEDSSFLWKRTVRVLAFMLQACKAIWQEEGAGYSEPERHPCCQWSAYEPDTGHSADRSGQGTDDAEAKPAVLSPRRR